jgi:hypothetical protein
MDIFSYIPIKILKMIIDGEIGGVSESVTRLKRTLPRFQPEIIRFDFHDSTDIRQPWEFTLDNINLSMVRVLTINASMPIYTNLVEGSPSSLAFVLPALEEVHISGVTFSDLGHILSSLDGNSFKLISVGRLYDRDTDLNAAEHRKSLQAPLGVISFSSVTSASWSLRPLQALLIEIFSRLVPNTQHLHFTFDLLYPMSTTTEDEEQLLSSCEGLEPQDGSLPFPHVTSMEGVFILPNECQFVDSVRKMLTRLIRLRTDAGAPPLVVLDITTGPREPDIPDGRRFGWEVRFRAVEVDKLT